MVPNITYSPVSNEKLQSGRSSNDGNDSDMLLLDEDIRRYTQRSRMKRYWAWIAHATSILVCLGLLWQAGRVYNKSRTRCIDKFNAYSPVNEALDHDYVPVEFKGSLWYQSPFKGPPTPEIEHNWYTLMQYGLIRVTEEDVLKVGHNSTSAQFPPEAGGGYIAATIGSHQLHCLHYIWQDHYMSYFPKVSEKAHRVPELYERHYEHCVDYIRQSLMCQFDSGIIPYNWVLDHDNPTPNANTHHKCVNWDAVQGWLKDRSVEIPEGFEWKQPADAVSLDWNP